MKENMKKCISQLNEYGVVQDAAVLSGDYKANNRLFKKINKAYEMINADEDRTSVYLELLRSAESASTLTSCCANMMKANVETFLARKKLDELVANTEIHPIFSFNAKMFLSEWDKRHLPGV